MQPADGTVLGDQVDAVHPRHATAVLGERVRQIPQRAAEAAAQFAHGQHVNRECFADELGDEIAALGAEVAHLVQSQQSLGAALPGELDDGGLGPLPVVQRGKSSR